MDSRNKRSDKNSELYRAITALDSLDDCYDFLVDLCTQPELKAMEQRYDVAVLLDQQGVAVRSGTHCAHPLFDALGMPQGVVRASLGLYNTLEDVERLCRALRRVAAIKL